MDDRPGPPDPTTAPARAAWQPLRLGPGEDLRAALEALAGGAAGPGAFVIAGIGSLVDARLRLAGQDAASVFSGPSELLTLSGTLTSDGAHLHAVIALADGRVVGGHVVHGNVVRTTVELLTMPLPDWQLSRAMDPATGYPELVVRARRR